MFATCFACFILLFYFLWSGIVKNETKISKRRLIDDEINTQEMTDIEIQIHNVKQNTTILDISYLLIHICSILNSLE